MARLGANLLFLILVAAASMRSASVWAADKPDLYLLSVGISQYQDKSIPALRFADDDARAMVSWAEGQKNRVYGDVHTQLLLDQQASRKAVLQAVLEFFRASQPHDQLILFLAGHGVVDPGTNSWHALPADGELANVTGTGIEQRDLLSRLDVAGRPYNRLLVLVDTCHAGALGDALTKQGGRGLGRVDGNLSPLNDQEVASRGGLWAIISAGTAQDKAQEGAEYRLPGEPETIAGHGLFTYALLKPLGSTAADGDNNGTVTLSEFWLYVEREVRTLSKGAQIPVLSGKWSDVALSFAVGAVERCDGVDNDWDGEVDESFPDLNHNGVADCLDKELCNGVDDNGDGQIDEGYDLDKDGHRAIALCGSQHGDDCDDADISIHPGQKDWGNLRDDDCDGFYDEDDFDLNGDGIPDLLGRQSRRYKTLRWASLGSSAVLLAASAFTYGRLFETYQDVFGELGDNQVESYAANSRRTATLGGLGLTLVGVSLVFTWEDLQFQSRYFPRKRPASHAETALKKNARKEGGAQ